MAKILNPHRKSRCGPTTTVGEPVCLLREVPHGNIVTAARSSAMPFFFNPAEPVHRAEQVME